VGDSNTARDSNRWGAGKSTALLVFIGGSSLYRGRELGSHLPYTSCVLTKGSFQLLENFI
jgi:hypothetical protein